MDDAEIHSYVQTKDLEAFANKDDEGAHAPMLLATLDLSHWTAIMQSAITDKAAGLTRLRQAHDVLPKILDSDELELEEASRNTKTVEAYLRLANPHESWTKDSLSIPTTDITGSTPPTTSPSPASHPLLSRLKLAPAHKSALEDLSESIQSTQAEAARVQLEATGRGPAIPFLPPRAVEEQLSTRSHRTWCINNINLLAPITTSMWKMWAFLSDIDVKRCEDKALSREGLLREPVIIPNAFPLALFDHHKCTSTKVQVLVKQDVLTCPPRHKKYSSTMWNCQRPYIRCTCEQTAVVGCKGTMLWFDHAIWFMINNLGRFFDDAYGTSLAGKFAAFVTWLSGAARPAVYAQITFSSIRRMMENAALEVTVNPTAKLLAKHHEAPGARMVERFIKPASFSLETAPSPSPATYKKRKYNASGATPPPGYVQPQMRNAFRGGSSAPQNRRGRGGYNKKFRSNNSPGEHKLNFDAESRTYDRGHDTRRAWDADFRYGGVPNPSPSRLQRGMPEEVSVITSTPPSISRGGSPATDSASSVVIKPYRSPMKGRVLDWADL